MPLLENVLYELLDNFKRNQMSAPLYLGGISASGGGVGGPAGGFVGKLPQIQITYDMTEEATDYTPLSGYTLLDNLNHIRYRIETLEGSNHLIVMEDTNEVASGVMLIKFGSEFDVTPITSGIYVTMASGVNLTGDLDYVSHVYNEVVGSIGTSHSTAQQFIQNSLRVFLNGVRQDPTQYTEDGSCLGFTTTFTVPSGAILEAEYDVLDTGATPSSSLVNLIVKENDVLVASGVSIINFEGAVEVTPTSSGVTITVTASGVGGGIEEAPLDGNPYNRKDGAWAVASGVTISGGITNHSDLTGLDYDSSGHTGFEPTKGDDDNYVSDAQLILLGNLSGSNTGDITVVDTSTVDLTLSGQQLSANVVVSGINHDATLGAGTNTHAQIDTALERLATTSGINSGDQDITGLIEEAPIDGNPYYRKDADWIVASGTSHDLVTAIDSATVDFTLTGQQLTADVIASGIKLDDLGTPDNNTDLNATSAHHGLLPALSDDATEFLNGAGNWATPSGLSSGGIEEAPIDGNPYNRKDAGWVVASGTPASLDFLGLTDTPDSYAGAGDLYVKVKTDQSGLEFATVSGISNESTTSPALLVYMHDNFR